MPPAEPLSIAQVAPFRRGVREPGQPSSSTASRAELERRGHEVLRVGDRRPGQEAARSSTPLDIVHVHEPFAPSVSSAALRHSYSLNVATFHAPQERVLSTQVARPLVEIFFGRIDARTVTSSRDRRSCWSATSRPPTSWSSPAGTRRDWARVADRVRSDLPAPARAPPRSEAGDPELRARIAERPLIEVDLHMHTDHSRRLRDPGRRAAADGPRPRPRGDRDHRPQRGLRGAGGARDRRARWTTSR